jgi:hypothetical protein
LKDGGISLGDALRVAQEAVPMLGDHQRTRQLAGKLSKLYFATRDIEEMENWIESKPRL